MSQHLPNLAIAAFKATLDPAYQSGSKLRGRVTEISGVEAETQRFPVIGVTDANERGTAEDVIPRNVRNAKPTASLTPDESFDYLDRQDTALTNVDAMRGYGMTHGKAVARRYDAKIIGAISAAFSTSETGPYNHPGFTATDNIYDASSARTNPASAAGLSAGHLSRAMEMLMQWDYDVDGEDVTLAYPSSQFSTMSDELKFASMDYMQGTGAPGVTKTGRFEEIYGCMPIFIGQKGRQQGKGATYQRQGALPDNRAYLFCRSAVGLAVGTTERLGVVEWVPQKRSWLVGAECNSGAIKIQAAGVVAITLP